MRQRTITIPELVLMAGTGLGLLIADKISRDSRKGAGWSLLAVGALTTIPIVTDVLNK